MKWGSENKKTDGWISTRVYKQVAKAKLDLIKTQLCGGGCRDLKYPKG